MGCRNITRISSDINGNPRRSASSCINHTRRWTDYGFLLGSLPWTVSHPSRNRCKGISGIGTGSSHPPTGPVLVEARDRDGHQDRDDSHNDHEFDQRETFLAFLKFFQHFKTLLLIDSLFYYLFCGLSVLVFCLEKFP
jgi:hypothetical protein